jgi:hypothetical protein
MWSQPARVARRLARWPLALAILVTGLAVIGWNRVGRAALTVARWATEATWPALRLLWPVRLVRPCGDRGTLKPCITSLQTIRSL